MLQLQIIFCLSLRESVSRRAQVLIKRKLSSLPPRYRTRNKGAGEKYFDPRGDATILEMAAVDESLKNG